MLPAAYPLGSGPGKPAETWSNRAAYHCDGRGVGQSMVTLIVAILSVLLPLLHLAFSKRPRTRQRVVEILLLYALVLDVGVIGLPLGFIPHIFFADETARSIGWAPGSPFQFEVGFHDGAWGLLGFLCLWIRGSFWTATGLGWAFFMFGAAYGHLREVLVEGNYAPYNFYTTFSDGFVAVWLVALVYLHWRWCVNKKATPAQP